ncbi:MAG: thioredoxin domain-containing protein [Verrucomicrobiota bacterium]
MKKNHCFRTLLVTALLLPIFGSQSVFAAETRKPAAIGALFYAESCGSCKVLDPKIVSAKEAMAEAPVLFVTFDHSTEATQNQAALLADQLGLKEVYESQKKASGFFLLIDPESGEILKTITKSATVEEIKSDLQGAIQS